MSPTALRAYDAADPTISIAAMVQHGAIVAPVYIRGNPGGFQPSDAKRVTALRKAGLAPWPNWESQADFFAHASSDDAKWAGKDARDAALRLGFPDDGSISLPFSFDYQIPTNGLKRAAGLLDACQEGLGGGFVATSYGQSSLIRYLGGHGFGATGHWLMASTWGLADFDIGSPHVAMVQSHDADGSWLNTPIPGTDANTVTRPDILAAWWPDDSPHGGTMPTADEIAAAVWKVKLSDGSREQPASAWLKQSRNLSDPKVVLDHLDKELAKLNLDPPTLAAVKLAAQQGVQAAFAKAAS